MSQTRRLLLLAAVAAAPVAAHDDHERHFPSERLEPAVDAEGLLNTSWASVPQHLDWDAALLFAYSNDPLFTYNVSPSGLPTDRAHVLVQDRLMAHLTGAIALFEWVQLGVELPVLVQQQRVDALAPPGEQESLAAMGVGDLRILPKLRLLQQRSGAPVDVGVQVPVTLPTGASFDYVGETGFSFTPTVLASRRWRVLDGNLRAAGNLGMRMRTRPSVLADGVAVAGNELIVRAGVGYQFAVLADHPTELAVSLASAQATSDFATDIPARSPLELLGEVEHGLGGPLSVFVGGAMGVIAGIGGPDFRAFAGVRFATRAPLDRDGDGVLDDDDKCAREPETKNGFEDADGCPDVDDKDGDGVRDPDDRCVDAAEDKDGFRDEDGCPDTDHDDDGLANDADGCPAQAEDKDGFEDEDGCPDVDNDKDGVLDAADACAAVAEDNDGFADADGCPEADNDNDGVLDASDKCPEQAGSSDNKGCPDPDRDGDSVVDRLDNCPDEKGAVENAGCAAKQKVVLKAGKLEILDKVFFKTGKDVIQEKSFALLDNVASVLAAHPEMKKVRVEGHTDDVGDAPRNKELSALRAKAVATYLVSKGQSAERFETVGFGSEQPIADNGTDEGRAKNRRVEFVIVGD
ncbi:MAG: OmpA family protein [Deltaproteobacteria bacterium]|nr:OmpA family protein [Deltaproteobacteria bacterium]